MSDAFAALEALGNPNVIAFVQDTRRRAAAAGVRFLFSDESRIVYPAGDSLRVSGYFIDRPEVVLGVAIGKPLEQWLPILVHESSHMDQWIESVDVWHEAFCQGKETVDFIDEWISGADDLPLPIEELVHRSMMVELDCERRSVAKIKQFNLPIDLDDYVRKAQAYVFFYEHMLESRAWYTDGRAPYELEEVFSCAPSRFSEDNVMPPALRQAFNRAYPPAGLLRSRPPVNIPT